VTAIKHPPLLQLEGVGRRRHGRAVVRDLDLRVARGEVLGLLGINGAGKSTTLAMLAGVLRPDAGHILLDGDDLAGHPDATRRLVGWLPERVPLWPELTVAETLAARGRLHGLRGKALRAARDETLERLRLGPLRQRLARALSQGQRQRLGLACAMLHRPALLVLDEPGNGLDPVQAADLRRLVREHADAGGAVVLSTHLLPEVTAVCDRAAILHEGRLRHDAALDDPAGTALELVLAEPAEPARLQALAPVARVVARDRCRFGITLAPGADTPALLRALLDAELAPVAVQPGRGALESLFMTIATREAAA